MNPIERACMNALLGEAIANWSAQRDGDLVELMQRLNAMMAIALRGVRSKDKPIAS
jgi:hypothetical protein